MTSMMIILALFAFAIPLASCQMDMDTVFFNATDFADSPNPGSSFFSGYLDKATNTFYWNFNFTSPGVTGLQALEIRDGKKDMDVLGKELQAFSIPSTFTGTRNFSGNFSDGIGPAVASNATELANHMCMSHIYAVVQTETGSQRAVINYDPKKSRMDCYAAVGLQGHSMSDMPMDMSKDMDMASAPLPSNSAGIISSLLALVVAILVAAL
ncbi:hypothetical protein Ndes2437B_g04161 [Nannochloris sp. 'desiccata']